MSTKHSTNGRDLAAVAYVRMSSDKQEASPKQQRGEIEKLAKRDGYRIIRWYTDEGISGDNTEKRKDFQRMIADVDDKGDFCAVLCWDIDRFGRFDSIEAGHWIYPLRQAGVKLVTVGQGSIDWNDFAGRVVYSIQQEAKNQFLVDMSRNVTRGHLNSAMQAKGTGGSVPYGYHAIRVYDNNGKLVESSLEVDPEAAAIVRRLFREYLEPGASLRGIAARLNEDEIPAQRGGKWHNTVVQQMLGNRKYTGDFVWGKNIKGKYHAVVKGEIVKRHRTDRRELGEPIIHEGNHEPIIDTETFERVQRRLDRMTANTSPRKDKMPFILSGLIHCGECGHRMSGNHVVRKTGAEFFNYRCTGYHNKGRAVCHSNGTPEKPLVDAIVRKLTEQYLSKERLESLKDEIRKEQRRGQKSKPTVSVASLRRKLKELDHKIDNGADRILAAPAAIVDDLYRTVEGLKKKRQRIADQIKEIEEPATVTTDGEREVRESISYLTKLRKGLATNDRLALRELLVDIIEGIELFFTYRKAGKYMRSIFNGGKVTLRPDPKLSILSGLIHW